MEQSLGVGDTRPVFNRQRVQLTHFQPLGKLETGSKQIPASVVVHAGVGACIGDQPPYELFTLGGPLQVSYALRCGVVPFSLVKIIVMISA